MKEKRNLYYLADIISSQTLIDRKLVVSFLNQFFKEIERGLMISSAVKIDNLGIFRIIKSLSADRLLFLSKLAGDTVSPRLNDNAPAGKTADTEADLSETWSHNAEYTNEQSEYINDSTPEAGDIDDENIAELSGGDERQAEKNKLSRRIKIFALFFVTLTVVVGVLYALYLYPKKNSDIVAERQQFSPSGLMFTELDNNDTIHFSHIIRVTGPNVDFYSLSKIYYLHEQFWPYIYNANENLVSSPLEIPEGTTIMIPKLDAELIDYKNQSSVDKAKVLVNKIMKANNSAVE